VKTPTLSPASLPCPAAAAAARLRRRRQQGTTIAEVTVASLIITMLVTGVLALTGTVSRNADRGDTESGMADDGRRSMDEVLLQLRGARVVLASGAIAGSTYTTGASAVVVEAPAYHPNASGVFLDGVTDRVAFRFAPAERGVPGRLIESIQPGSGSVRPARSEKTLARDVAGVTFRFRARERFEVLQGGGTTFSLSAPPLGTPTAFVNGVQTRCEGSGSSFRVVPPSTRTQDAIRAGDEVQFLYEVSPGGGSAVLSRVTQIDVIVRTLKKDARRIDRELTLQGSARLRNQRL